MTDTTVSDIIWQQLGGHRFAVMTGARYPTAIDDRTLRFQVPGGGGRTKGGINTVEIKLDPSDTYTMTFYRVTRSRTKFEPVIKQVDRREDVYNDALCEVFERVTGLATRL